MAVSPFSTNIAIRRDTAAELKVVARHACEPCRRRVTGIELADHVLHSAMMSGEFELGGVHFKVKPEVVKKEAQEELERQLAEEAKRLPRKPRKPAAKRK